MTFLLFLSAALFSAGLSLFVFAAVLWHLEFRRRPRRPQRPFALVVTEKGALWEIDLGDKTHAEVAAIVRRLEEQSHG